MNHVPVMVFIRYDLLQVDHGVTNDTIVARATNVGQTTLKVAPIISKLCKQNNGDSLKYSLAYNLGLGS